MKAKVTVEVDLDEILEMYLDILESNRKAEDKYTPYLPVNVFQMCCQISFSEDNMKQIITENREYLGLKCEGSEIVELDVLEDNQ